jgi:very-short-patch-repair endonuclease
MLLVQTLDGHQYSLKLKDKKSNNKSKLHLKARRLLKQLTSARVIEEVPIKITRGQILYLDFFVPSFKCAVEVNGRQHYERVHRFHKNPMDYLNQLKNDRLKAEWCEINRIDLIILSYKDDEEQWKRLLLGDNTVG